MKSESASADVAIVGGGFSGTMLAAHLARRGLTSVLVEGGGRAGRGTAFSTPEQAHVLNVVAGRMSAWSDRPDHFIEAISAEGYSADDYVPRPRFGAYLSNILAEAGEAVTLARQVALAAVPTEKGWTVTLADGSEIEAGALALAQGNQPPEPLRVAQDLPADLFVNDPWSDAALEAVARVSESGGDVLVVGTGLTMVDVVLSLDEAGHRGRILALSRRGLAPRAHAAHEPAPVEWDEVPAGSVTALWNWLRARASVTGWRAAVDSLRPHSHKIWRSLDEEEQGRFLRHARAWWDVHRHRIAPDVAGRMKRLIMEGRLQVAAGRIAWMRAGNRELEVGIKRRGADAAALQQFALGINCTGPLGNIARSEDGVIRAMFDAGLARPNRLGIGIEVDEHSRIDGAARAWALGPLTKGALWEIVAVPDIRGQVADVAEDISRELDR